MIKTAPLFALALCLSGTAAAEPLVGRAETNLRYGDERSIFMTEFWAPILQGDESVLYGDLRLMGDDQENREGNLGLGYRHRLTLPLLSDGVAGVHGWVDKRRTERGSNFYQTTLGAEWLGDILDLRVNGYIGLSGERRTVTADTIGDPYFSGSSLFLDVKPGGEVVEETLDGFDGEIGVRIPVFETAIDSIRLYGGAYHFSGDNSGNVSGWRTRFTTDINSDVQIGARFQKDDERGSQGFLEATIRFPFGNKRSVRKDGVLARLDESPERDIDIVTGAKETPSGTPARSVELINANASSAQKIIHVDNSAAGGGDGSNERPFDRLQDAEAAAAANDIIYVHRGDGTASKQSDGITLANNGMMLAGSGAALRFDPTRFEAAGLALPSSLVLIPAGAAPVITNSNPDGDAVTITADNVAVQGIVADSASRYGIAVRAEGAGASAMNTRISDIAATGNKTGLYIHGADGGALSVAVDRTMTSGNLLHGVSVYDDTAGAYDVDLGGGTLGSAGRNILAGNGLEDITVDYDGHALSAAGNWWGQAGGPAAGQVYFGAPIDDALVGHWLLDETSGTTVSSRIGNHDGGFVNSPAPASGINNGALTFDRADGDYVSIADFDETDNGDKLTVSYWVNPATLIEGDTHVAKWEEAQTVFTSSWGIRSIASPDEFLFFMANPNYDQGDNYFLTSNMDLQAGTWTNITFVYDGAGLANADRLKVYKNGAQVAGSFGGVIPTNLGNSNEAITFGRRLIDHPVYGRYLDGSMDDVRIYNSALSQDSVGEIVRSRADSSLVTGQSLSSPP